MAKLLPKTVISDDEQQAFLHGKVNPRLFRLLAAKERSGMRPADILRQLNAIEGVRISPDSWERMVSDNQIIIWERDGERGPNKAVSGLLIPQVATIFFHDGYGGAQKALAGKFKDHCEHKLQTAGSVQKTGLKLQQLKSGVKDISRQRPGADMVDTRGGGFGR